MAIRGNNIHIGGFDKADPVTITEAMQAFDALPKPLRDFINYSELKWCSVRALEGSRALGADRMLRAFRDKTNSLKLSCIENG